MDDSQDAPIEEGSDEATNEQSVQGVVDQVRADIDVGHTHEQVLTLLQERFTQSNLDVSNERAQQLAEELIRNRS